MTSFSTFDRTPFDDMEQAHDSADDLPFDFHYAPATPDRAALRQQAAERVGYTPTPAFTVGQRVVICSDVDFSDPLLRYASYYEALRDQRVVGIVTIVTPVISTIFEGSKVKGYVYDVDFQDGHRLAWYEADELEAA